jgi:pyrroloquinoline quinone biosynthesis protein D
MSKDRGSRRAIERGKKAPASPSRAGKVQLAPDVRLETRQPGQDGPVLVCPAGRVRLNGGAVAILQLCDGSRNREDIVAEMLRRSQSQVLVADITAFLDEARSQGWTIEMS